MSYQSKPIKRRQYEIMQSKLIPADNLKYEAMPL